MIKNIISQISLNDLYQIFFVLCAVIFFATKLKKQIHKLFKWIKWKKENCFVKKTNRKYEKTKVIYINTRTR